MEGFSYTNIFETKGIEYILVILFLLSLIPFWMILNRKGKLTSKIRQILNVLTFDTLKIPQGIFYSRNHTWAFMEKSGRASIGLDDFLLQTTGNVKLNKLKNPGEIINRGDLMAEVEIDQKTLNIYSPVSGKIESTNELLSDNPEVLNQDPFGKGWVYKIKPIKWMDEIKSCYLAEDATNWSKNEMIRFKDFLAAENRKYSPEQAYTVLQDGGELTNHTLSLLPDDIWKDYQKSFLQI
jgi:glycine cleavage system H protein